jgi:hypothetical protein
MRAEIKGRKSKGNPNWGKWQPPRLTYGPSLTEFERLILKLDLKTEQACVESPELKQWVYSNANQRYIPEWLLAKLGVTVHVSAGDLI